LVIVFGNSNWVSFNILAVFDIKDLLLLSNIDELAEFILEDLEPL
jgi:hypothetical protein